MGRKIKDASLQSREARGKLKTRNEPYWRVIHQGLHVGYRKGKQQRAWLVRRFANGKYIWRTLGQVNDVVDADGKEVLDWAQAQALAQAFDRELKISQGVIVEPKTVKDATDSYLEWFRKNRKGVDMAESAIRAHILPTLGDKKLSELTTKGLNAWLQGVAFAPARLRSSKGANKPNTREAKTDDRKRARKSTANRILTVLKAVLNKAFNDGAIESKNEWSRVKPFKDVDSAKVRFLTTEEAQRLMNACPPDFRGLVRAALLTGARLGDLVGMPVSDVHIRDANVYISKPKMDKPRYVPLNPEGVEHFKAAITGKTGADLVFTRSNGNAWAESDHKRPMELACKIGKIEPRVTFHELRHTYASFLANAGLDLLRISRLLGHSGTRMTAKHYAHLTDKTLSDAVMHLPSFDTAAKDGLRAVA